MVSIIVLLSICIAVSATVKFFTERYTKEMLELCDRKLVDRYYFIISELGYSFFGEEAITSQTAENPAIVVICKSSKFADEMLKLKYHCGILTIAYKLQEDVLKIKYENAQNLSNSEQSLIVHDFIGRVKQSKIYQNHNHN